MGKKKDDLKHEPKGRNIPLTIGVFIIIFILVAIALVFAMSALLDRSKAAVLSDSTYWSLNFVIDISMTIFYLFNVRINVQNYIRKTNSDFEDAHWLTKKEIKDSREFITTTWEDIGECKDGVVVEAESKKGDVNITMTTQLHAIVVGSTGAGKTSGFVDQNIAILSSTKTKPSLIITDPKGELYERHAKSLEKRGYNVQVLDLIEPYTSSQWNPLMGIQDRVRLLGQIGIQSRSQNVYKIGNRTFNGIDELNVYRQQLEDEILESAMDLVYTLCPIKNNQEPMWESGARDLILAMVLALVEDAKKGYMPVEKLTLFNVSQNLTTYLTNTCKELKLYLVESRDIMSPVRKYAQTVLITEDRTLTSYLTSVSGYLKAFADTGILSMTSGNSITLSKIDERPTVIFLEVPLERETRYDLVKLFCVQTYKDLVQKSNQNRAEANREEEEEARSKSAKKLKRKGIIDPYEEQEKEAKKASESKYIPIQQLREEQSQSVKKTAKNNTGTTATLKRRVYFLLDEFGSFPKFENIGMMTAVGRSIGIRFVFILQDFAQLSKTYGDNDAKTIKSNCNVKIYLATQDEQTRKEFSDLMGSRRAVNMGINTSNESAASSHNSVQTVPLLSAAELAKVNGETKGRAIVCIQGYSPLDATFTPSFRLEKTYFEAGKVLTRGGKPSLFNKKAAYYDIMSRMKLPTEQPNQGQQVQTPITPNTGEKKETEVPIKQVPNIVAESPSKLTAEQKGYLEIIKRQETALIGLLDFEDRERVEKERNIFERLTILYELQDKYLNKAPEITLQLSNIGVATDLLEATGYDNDEAAERV